MILKIEDINFGKSNYFLQLTNGRKPFTISHTHEFYEIMCVIKGSSTQIINSKRIKLPRQSLYFLRPGDTHQILSQTENTNILSLSVKPDTVNSFLSVYGSVLSNLIEKSAFPPSIEFDSHASSYISNAHKALICQQPEEYEMYCNIILGKVIHSFALQGQLANSIDTVTHDKLNKNLLVALNKINHPENIAKGVPYLQELSGYSRPQLCRLMKNHLNQTPSEYIQNLRLNYALNLLRHTNTPISIIAEQVGFSSTSYFVSIFKDTYGITPLQKRKEYNTTEH